MIAPAHVACRTSTTRSEANTPGFSVARTTPVRAWDVRSNGRTLGSLIRYEDPSDSERAMFIARDREQHDLGLVDVHGRAWRYVLKSREPEWLGTGTVTHATALIFAVAGEVELVEVPLASFRATAAGAPK